MKVDVTQYIPHGEGELLNKVSVVGGLIPWNWDCNSDHRRSRKRGKDDDETKQNPAVAASHCLFSLADTVASMYLLWTPNCIYQTRQADRRE